MEYEIFGQFGAYQMQWRRRAYAMWRESARFWRETMRRRHEPHICDAWANAMLQCKLAKRGLRETAAKIIAA